MLYRNALIFVVISVLVVALMYSSLSASYTSTYYVFAAPKDPNWGKSGYCAELTGLRMMCCWEEEDVFGDFFTWCQECDSVGTNCFPVSRASEQPPTPPPGPGGPLGSIPEGGGILPELEQTPPSPSPEEIAPTIDCTQNPDDPLCETARIPEGPEGLTPQVDCNENPNNPLCETARIPEAGEQQQPQVEEEQAEEDQLSEDGP